MANRERIDSISKFDDYWGAAMPSQQPSSGLAAFLTPPAAATPVGVPSPRQHPLADPVGLASPPPLPLATKTVPGTVHHSQMPHTSVAASLAQDVGAGTAAVSTAAGPVSARHTKVLSDLSPLSRPMNGPGLIDDMSLRLPGSAYDGPANIFDMFDNEELEAGTAGVPNADAAAAKAAHGGTSLHGGSHVSGPASFANMSRPRLDSVGSDLVFAPRGRSNSDASDLSPMNRTRRNSLGSILGHQLLLQSGAVMGGSLPPGTPPKRRRTAIQGSPDSSDVNCGSLDDDLLYPVSAMPMPSAAAAAAAAVPARRMSHPTAGPSASRKAGGRAQRNGSSKPKRDKLASKASRAKRASKSGASHRRGSGSGAAAKHGTAGAGVGTGTGSGVGAGAGAGAGAGSSGSHDTKTGTRARTKAAASSSHTDRAPGMIGTLTPEERAQRIQRYLEKRKRRVWKKKINYRCRQKLADGRLRVKGRFVSRAELDKMGGAAAASAIAAATAQAAASGGTDGVASSGTGVAASMGGVAARKQSPAAALAAAVFGSAPALMAPTSRAGGSSPATAVDATQAPLLPNGVAYTADAAANNHGVKRPPVTAIPAAQQVLHAGNARAGAAPAVQGHVANHAHVYVPPEVHNRPHVPVTAPPLQLLDHARAVRSACKPDVFPPRAGSHGAGSPASMMLPTGAL